MKGDETRILEGGCEAYIAKPISVAAFLETIRRLLEDGEAGGKGGDVASPI
jgi:two-component system cell cycle response regulator DivK